MKKLLTAAMLLIATTSIASASSFDYNNRLKKHNDLLAAGKHSNYDVAGDGWETCIPSVCYVGEHTLEPGTLKPVVTNARELLLAANRQPDSIQIASTEDVQLKWPWIEELAKQNSLTYDEMIAIIDDAELPEMSFKSEVVHKSTMQHQKEIEQREKNDSKGSSGTPSKSEDKDETPVAPIIEPDFSEPEVVDLSGTYGKDSHLGPKYPHNIQFDVVDNGNGTFDVTTKLDNNTLDGKFEADKVYDTVTFSEDQFKEHITGKGFSK